MINNITVSLLLVIGVFPAALKYSYDRLKTTMRLDVRVHGIVIRYGSRQLPDANVRTVKWDNGFLGGKEYITGRYPFTTKSAMQSFKFTEPHSSGLLGPVTIQELRKNKLGTKKSY